MDTQEQNPVQTDQEAPKPPVEQGEAGAPDTQAEPDAPAVTEESPPAEPDAKAE